MSGALLLLAAGSCLAAPELPCHNRGERYFVSDHEQCDRFHMCDETGALAAEFLCEDGLVFDAVSGQCGLPTLGSICPQPRKLQPAQPVGGCQRLNGKWPIEDTCNQYTDCSSGIEQLVTCQNHLVYDDESGQCEHPDRANRQGCTAEELYEFTCPAGVAQQARFPAHGDCRAFFTCAVFTDYHPRLGGCPVGTVFNDVKEICDAPANVPRCKDYYAVKDVEEGEAFVVDL